MVLRSISLKDIFKLIPYKRINDLIPLIKVELILEVNFETFGQVRFKDENGRPWIKEFSGSKWAKELYFRELREVSFSVFVNNQYLKEGRHLKLIKKVDNEIIDQAEFQLSGEKLFEGWFKLG
jgi:hypothetical protein